jgi:hypothetical protein
MENRDRILLVVGVDIFRSSASEEHGTLELLDRARKRFRFRAKSLGAETGYFHEEFIKGAFEGNIEQHIAADTRGSSSMHMRVRMRKRGMPYRLSQRCGKKIEELFGEGKEFHGLRRFRQRQLYRVREETWLIGWVLNLKRLAKLLTVQPVAL